MLIYEHSSIALCAALLKLMELPATSALIK